MLAATPLLDLKAAFAKAVAPPALAPVALIVSKVLAKDISACSICISVWAKASCFWTSFKAACSDCCIFAWAWACMFCWAISWSFCCFFFLLSFSSWLASLMLFISLKSIASSKSIACCCTATWMLFSSICFSSSSGFNSINIPKSCMCSSDISSSVATLWTPILCINASLAGEYSIMSDILSIKPSANSLVKWTPLCSICLVAVFEFAAANFWTPTNALGSGVLPSLASFNPVTSLIICR